MLATTVLSYNSNGPRITTCQVGLTATKAIVEINSAKADVSG